VCETRFGRLKRANWMKPRRSLLMAHGPWKQLEGKEKGMIIEQILLGAETPNTS